jgi:hypothetical protein
MTAGTVHLVAGIGALAALQRAIAQGPAEVVALGPRVASALADRGIAHADLAALGGPTTWEEAHAAAEACFTEWVPELCDDWLGFFVHETAREVALTLSIEALLAARRPSALVVWPGPYTDDLATIRRAAGVHGVAVVAGE